MKILMVNPAMKPVCGRTVMVMHLAHGLQERGHEVSVLTGTDSDHTLFDDVPYEVAYTRMDPAKKTPGAIFDLRNGLANLVSDMKPDIIHTHHRYPAYVVKYISTGAARHISTVHSFLRGKRGFHVKPDTWVAVSGPVRAWMRDKYNINPGRIVVIQNGAAEQPQQPGLAESFERNGLSVLAAGRFAPEKGFDVLLKAWRDYAGAVERPGRLVIAGEGPEYARLSNLTKGMRESVEITNGSGRMDELYQQANLVVVPSLTEPLSYIVLEAGMRGIPLIVTDSGGPGELLAGHKTGTVVPPDDAQVLAEALTAAAESYDTMLEQAQKLRSVLQERNSIKTMVDAYIRLYEQNTQHGTQ